MRLSIAELEDIINFFRDLHPSKDQITLCVEARHLGSVYGTMIHERRRYVDVAGLSLQQRSAVAKYLNAHPHLVPAPANGEAPSMSTFADRDEDASEHPGPA